MSGVGGKKAGKGRKGQDSDSEHEDSKGFDFGAGSAAGEKFEFGGKDDPNLLKLLQQKLGLAANAQGFFDALPEQVKGRVYVLKHLHEERRLLEVDFKKEYEALQQKYRTLYQPLYDQRSAIIVGAVEPPADQVLNAKTKAEERRRAKLAADGADPEPEKPAGSATHATDAKGIPDFWLQALKFHVDLRELVEPEDEPALRHLTDIRWHPLPENPVSFVLEFHFSPNEFFEETVLSKTYHMQENADSGDLHFSRVDSPTITWKAGKNLCVKQVTKQQKKKGGRKGKGAAPTRTITVEEPVNSFFHFFNPEAFLNLQPDLEEEDYEQFLEDDYVMGTEIKDKLIPFGVLYFTGEMEQDEEYDDGEDGEDDEDDDEEQDDEDDQDEGEYKAPPVAGGAKPECNQQ